MRPRGVSAEGSRNPAVRKRSLKKKLLKCTYFLHNHGSLGLKMEKHLLIIDSYPTQLQLKKLTAYLIEMSQPNTEASVFFVDYGVFWLLDEYWEAIYRPSFLYYAHVHDAEKYSIPFKEEVVFSGMPALQQLVNAAEHVEHFEEDTVFPEPMLTGYK